MFSFTNILSDLQAAIAARAARDRALTVLLVALWGRIARMGARLERLVALWRAGKLPKARAPQIGRVSAPRAANGVRFPSAQGWLLRKLGFEVAAFGSQLQHLLTDAECTAFLAAVPQSGRILRPLLRMLTVDPAPEVVRRVRKIVAAVVPKMARAGIVVSPGFRILEG